MKLEFRPLRKEDAPDLTRIENEIFTVPWSERAFAELPEKPYGLYLTAVADGEIVGCAGMVILGDEGDVDKVMVAGPYRRQGIATQLLETLLAQGEERGTHAFTLEVRVSNAPAIALYRKLGFVSEGVRPNFYEKPAEDALIMWRRSSGEE